MHHYATKCAKGKDGQEDSAQFFRHFSSVDRLVFRLFLKKRVIVFFVQMS